MHFSTSHTHTYIYMHTETLVNYLHAYRFSFSKLIKGKRINLFNTLDLINTCHSLCLILCKIIKL